MRSGGGKDHLPRLAQRPGSYVVLKYVRCVVKHLDAQTVRGPPAVLESSIADISLLAGLRVDKFQCHVPLYRQHQHLHDAGITVSRASLTQWTQRTIDLLRPIVDAQRRHLLHSKVMAMDETPIKAAGRQGKGKGKGKMRQAYLWPLYGEDEEVVFHYTPSREHRYAEQQRTMTHAVCWDYRPHPAVFRTRPTGRSRGAERHQSRRSQTTAPDAAVSFDSFHVVALANRALDQVCRAEVKTHPELKHSRWGTLKAPRRGNDKQILTMRRLQQRSTLKTTRAWRLTEALRRTFKAAQDRITAGLSTPVEFVRFSPV